MSFDTLIEPRFEAGLEVIVAVETKNSVELKYGPLRRHLAIEYQVILIGTRASDS